MNKYFIKLFDYDRSTNLKMINLLTDGEQLKTAIELMSHLLAAQQIWFKRCRNESTTACAIWPKWSLQNLQEIADANHNNWVDFLQTLTVSDFEKSIVYRNSKGISFANRLDDIVTHLINHGTHHRAQIGQQLKLTGLTLPTTDYIFYIRE
ncbi:MAG TPA: DinB family protein [Pseudosphingobacterium sp.]|nr:DinB family protein [Pseudosphingobacterium sp.]